MPPLHPLPALLAAAVLAGAPARGNTPAESPATPPPAAALAQAMKAGVGAMKRGDWDQAAAAWSEAVKLDPASAGAWANLGTAQLRQHAAAKAIPSLEKAVALQPSLAGAWQMLGMAYAESGTLLRAVSCATRAAHENPGDARIRNSLAVILKQNNWPGAAEMELQKALDLDPGCAEAHFNLAVLYLERRPPSLEMARRHYDAARSFGAGPDESMEARLAAPAEPAPAEPAPAPARKLSKPTTRPKS